MSGTLYVVGTPIGNLNDITFRALEVLKTVDLIACEDTRQTLKLLNHYGIKRKLTSYHKFNESKKCNGLIKELKNGKNIAIVTDAGTPCISDPGYILVKEAHINDIEVIGIPGASASVTSLSVSGMDTSKFSFVGFLPTESKKITEELNIIKNSSINTFVIYESPKRIVKLVEKIKDTFSEANLYIASDLTKIHERGFFGNINQVYETIKNDKNIEKGEYVIILEKRENRVNDIQDENYSIEAELVNVVVNQKCTIKDAINILSESKKYKKNDIYSASLNLKELFKKGR